MPERGVGRREVGARGDRGEDLDQLVVAVVVELSVSRNRLSSPGFDVMKRCIGLRVAGDDHQQLVAVVLHLLDQRIDRFAAEIVARERVRLVDEQRAAERGRR